MSKLRHITRKTDANHAEIMDAFRDLNYSVLDIHTIGHGSPDLLVGKFGENFLIEVKDGTKSPSKRRKTTDEEEFFASWLGNVYLIQSVEEVVEFDRTKFSGWFKYLKSGFSSSM